MEEKSLVKVSAFNLPISTKHAIELCSFIKGKNINKVKTKLNLVIEEKFVIKLTRFDKKRAHKKGHLGPGFYPKKASKHFLNLLNTLEGNAKNLGFDVEKLFIQSAIANKASLSWHYSRHRGRRMKRSHVTIFAAQEKNKQTKK